MANENGFFVVVAGNEIISDRLTGKFRGGRYVQRKLYKTFCVRAAGAAETEKSFEVGEYADFILSDRFRGRLVECVVRITDGRRRTERRYFVEPTAALEA